jgi:BirA family biotin operon repressor/biotin-[acetyl-CoA-carboxylase] ligase
MSIIGSKLIYLSSVSSTNDYALELISEGSVKDGTVIFTDKQTKGKGQHNNSWFSEPGQNISLSVILHLNFIPANKIFVFNKAMALAIRSFLLSHIQSNVQIKWPNDIYASNRKISGMLIQNLISGKKIKQCILGIGININQEVFPDSLPQAVSLKQLTSKSYEIEILVLELLQHLESYFKLLKGGSFEKINRSFNKALYGNDVLSTFLLKNGEKIEASIHNVNQSGQIGLWSQGKLRYWNHGEIQQII